MLFDPIMMALVVVILMAVGPPALFELFPQCALARRCRWALLPGAGEEEDTQAYSEDTHAHLVAKHECYGDTFVQRRRGQKVLFVRSPRAVKDVLMSNDFGKVWQTGEQASSSAPALAEYVHNLVLPLLVDPLFSKKGNATANSDVRTMMAPLFQGSGIFATGFATEVNKALDIWPDGEEIDALALVHDAIRGALYHAIAGAAADQLHAVATPVFHQALDYFVTRYRQPGHDQKVTPADEKVMTALHLAAIAVVGRLRALHAAAANQSEDADGTPMPPRALAAIMLSMGFTDEEVAAVIVNTVIAGAEAPASALAHTLRELSRRPELQQQLRTEVASAGWAEVAAAERAAAERTEAPKTGAAARWAEEMGAALEKLPLGKACVLEGLRLFAPATLVKRQALRGTHVDNTYVPEGTFVELCVTAIHSDPKQFEEPEVFDPQRNGFRAAIGSTAAFMPFSGGRRGCPGRPLALTMMRVTLACILNRFRLEPSLDKPPPPTTGTMHADAEERVRKFIVWPANGVHLRVISGSA